jgi:hypothetical protein
VLYAKSAPASVVGFESKLTGDTDGSKRRALGVAKPTER